MEIATGYFISWAPAVEAARELNNLGFKTEVLGNENQEDFHEGQMTEDHPDVLEPPLDGYVGISSGVTAGVNSYMLSANGPVVSAKPLVNIIKAGMDREVNGILNAWGVPREIDHEIKSVVDSGGSVVLVEYEIIREDDVKRALKKNGAQNIHV